MIISPDSITDDSRTYVNKIINTDVLVGLRALPRGAADIVVTSPPYNLKNSTGNGMKDGRGGKWANAALQRGYAGHSDAMPHDEYVTWQRDILTELMRVTTDDGAIFYNHKWRVQNGLLQDRSDIVSGFPVRQVIIWRRKGGINFNKGYYLPTYEVIYLIAKKNFKLAQGASGLGDVWDIGQELKNPHPAPFPEELVARIVGSTNAGIVLDPFMGSGTTAVATQALGKQFIGIEQSTDYCSLAALRITGDKAWRVAR